MGHLQVSSVSSLSFFGFSGSKFLSNNKALNLAFRLSFSCLISTSFSNFAFGEVEGFFETVLASKFNRCALPITAFRIVSPINAAICEAVCPFVHSAFNLFSLSGVQLIFVSRRLKLLYIVFATKKPTLCGYFVNKN